MIKCHNGKCFDTESDLTKISNRFEQNNIADAIELDLLKSLIRY